MTHPLRIAAGLSLPLDAVTETFGIVAIKGAGKTYTAKVMAEELTKAGQPVVVIDPLGVWWGLRSSADGRSAGLPFVILGGDHADAPLEPTGGEIVADFVVDQRPSLVVDLSHFRKGEAANFVRDFAIGLYRKNRQPLHLMVDEADLFAPQSRIDRKDVLGAMEDLVRRGRARGIGMTLVTQRPAVIHKDVLTQISTLVALRLSGPQDRAAIDTWVQAHGTREQRDELMASLASLPTGEAWFWSPSWLDVFQRVKIRRAETFDSSATPKAGARAPEPRTLAAVDLEALKERMAATIEKAKENDPKELRRRIRALERQLSEPETARPEPIVERVEVPVLDEDITRRLQEEFAAIRELLEDRRTLLTALERFGTLGPSVATEERSPKAGGSGVIRDPAEVRRRLNAPPQPRSAERSEPRPVPQRAGGGEAPERLSKAPRLILGALAQYHPATRTKQQVALLTGYAAGGGAFANALGALRSAGYIEGKGELRITPAGLEALGDDWEPLPTGSELARYWMDKLGHAEGEILRVLTEAWPEELPVEEVAARTVSSKGEPYAPGGGGFSNPLGRLRTLGLVVGRGTLRVNEDLVD